MLYIDHVLAIGYIINWFQACSRYKVGSQLIEDKTTRAGAVHGVLLTKFSIDGTVWTLKLRE